MEDGNKGIRRYLRNIKYLFLFLYFKHMALALAISEFQMPALIVTHEMQSREWRQVLTKCEKKKDFSAKSVYFKNKKNYKFIYHPVTSQKLRKS